MGNIDSLAYFVPELILTATVVCVLIAGILRRETGGYDLPALTALGGTAAAFLAHLALYGKPATLLFEGIMVHDAFAVFFRGFTLLTTLIVLVMTVASREILHHRKAECYAILISVATGMCLVVLSQDLLMAYLALELMSIGSYVLAGFANKIGRSEEAALKYMLYGAISSGILLFGLSLLYGLTGSTQFSAVRTALTQNTGNIQLAAYTIFLMILTGVGYKIAMVPFHFWAPDVYEGAPTPVTAFLSVASKGAGFALLIRLFFSVVLAPSAAGDWSEVPTLHLDWTGHIAVLSAVTMTFGNLAAYPQTSLKRLLAYSGIAHAGYLLMGVCLLTRTGMESVILYLIMYLFTNLAAFAVVMIVVDANGDDQMADIRCLGQRAPVAAVIMTIALFSLIGLPPTAGFVGKYYLFVAVLREGFYWLALIGVFNTVVSLFYYARILKAMFLENPVDARSLHPIQVRPTYAILLWALVIPTLYLGVFWNPLVEYARWSAHLIP